MNYTVDPLDNTEELPLRRPLSVEKGALLHDILDRRITWSDDRTYSSDDEGNMITRNTDPSSGSELSVVISAETMQYTEMLYLLGNTAHRSVRDELRQLFDSHS